MPRLQEALPVLFSGIMVGLTGYQLSPILKDLELRLGTDTLGVTRVLTAWQVAHTVVQLGVGPVLQRFGHRLVLVGALLLVAAANLGLAGAHTVERVVALRVLSGVATGSAFVAGIYAAAVWGETSRARLVRGMYGASINAGIVLGFGVIPWTHGVGWEASFAVQVALAVLALVWILVGVTRDGPRPAVGVEAGSEGARRGVCLETVSPAMTHFLTYGVFVATTSWGGLIVSEVVHLGRAGASTLLVAAAILGALGRAGSGTLLRFVSPRSLRLWTSAMGVGLFLSLSLTRDVAAAGVALAALMLVTNLAFAAVFRPTAQEGTPMGDGTGLAVISFMGNLGAILLSFGLGVLTHVTGDVRRSIAIAGIAVAPLLLLVNLKGRRP